MKKLILSLTILMALCSLSLRASDTLFVKECQVPILLEREDNYLFKMRIRPEKKDTEFQKILLSFGKDTKLSDIASVKIYYSGVCPRNREHLNLWEPVEYISRHTANKTLSANPSYSILKSEVTDIESTIELAANTKLYPGINYFWVSIQMKGNTDLRHKLQAKIVAAYADNKEIAVKFKSAENIQHRLGRGIALAGDFGANVFRIPGLATSNKGTLLGVFDVRYNNHLDLQEHIDIGLRRSEDGGQSWSELVLPLSFKQEGGLPAGQNGVGDPSIWKYLQKRLIQDCV